MPSYSFLWSEEDVNAGHYRRYSLRNITELLKSVGFQVEFSSYIFRFLPLPIFLLRTLPFKLGISIGKDNASNVSRDHAVRAGAGGNILDSILKAEVAKLDMKRPMSFGGSCLVVAKKT